MFSRRFDRLSQRERARLGIFGGTFDPIHLGHLVCAEQVAEKLGLDGVVFLPAYQPVFKLGRSIVDARHRLALCELATEGNPLFDVSGLEIDRGGPTYTVDTLSEVRSLLSDSVELFFITGMDALKMLPLWRDTERLARLATFVTATRPGYEENPLEINDLRKQGFAIETVPVTGIDVSSSDIRTMLAEGRSVRYLVPEAVLTYIHEHHLYEGDD